MDPRHPLVQHFLEGNRPSVDLNRIQQIKTYWKERANHSWFFYCPLCRAPRKIPLPPNPINLRNIIRIGLTSFVAMLAFWPVFGWKGLVCFVPIWTIFEIIYRIRIRAALTCVQCGFDPFLYLVDVPRARQTVEQFWRKKFAEKGIPYPGAEKSVQTHAAPRPQINPESALTLPHGDS